MASSKGTGVVIGVSVGVLLLLLVGVAAASGGPAKPDPEKPKPDKPADKPPDKPAPPPPDKPADKPPPNDVPPGALEFDLSNNWGICPLELRVWLARIELAARIPGLARALFVKAWQAWRADQALVDIVAAADLATKNPELCRLCFNPGDGADSKERLDKNIKAGWPTPKDYAGWAAGSYGLFDILGAVAVYSGILTGKTLPLINLDAAPAMRRYDVQGLAAASIIRQLLFSEKYPVLVGGVNNAKGDSLNTWGNVFAAWAQPDNFSKGKAQDVKERYLKRAVECGVDLAAVAYPWPPGQKYDVKNWTVQAVWTRLQDYKDRVVTDIGGGVVPQPAPLPDLPPDPAPNNEPPKIGALVDVGGGLKAAPLLQVSDPKIAAPLVIVLHGREGDEQQLVPFVPDLGARVFFLRGNVAGPKAGTWSFFQPRLADPEAVLLPAMKAALGNILGALAQLQAQYPTTRVLVLGGSQGGALAYALAAIGAVDGAVAVSGSLPATLRPKKPAATVVVGVHGTADTVVPYQSGEATLDSFAAAGFLYTKWIEKKGGGHALTSAAPDVRQVLQDLVGDTYLPELGIALTEACQIVVPDPQDATWSVSKRAVELARDLYRQRKGPLGKPDVTTVLQTLVVEIAPFCALGGTEFADKTAALDGYFVFRATLRALQTRGLLAAGIGAASLSDFRSQAIQLGVPAASLPTLDLP